MNLFRLLPLGIFLRLISVGSVRPMTNTWETIPNQSETAEQAKYRISHWKKNLKEKLDRTCTGTYLFCFFEPANYVLHMGSPNNDSRLKFRCCESAFRAGFVFWCDWQSLLFVSGLCREASRDWCRRKKHTSLPEAAAVRPYITIICYCYLWVHHRKTSSFDSFKNCKSCA